MHDLLPVRIECPPKYVRWPKRWLATSNRLAPARSKARSLVAKPLRPWPYQGVRRNKRHQDILESKTTKIISNGGLHRRQYDL